MGDAGGPPGKLRSMLIKMLGGNTEPGQMPAASPYPPGWAPPPAAPQAPQVPVPPAYPYGQSWLPMAPGGPPAPPLPPTPSDSFGYVQPITPPSPAARTPDEADEEGMTRMMGGADLQRLKMPSRIFTLQILDKGQDWHNWTVISAAGLKVGRSEKNVQFPELSSMATRHLRIGYEGGRVKLEDLGALNGIFLRVTRPVELEDGSEFRVGDRVFRFRAAAPVEPVGPRVAEDGEEFWSGDLHALAYLDAIRPDGEVGLRFPITKRDATILGRGGRPGKPVDIALPDDEIVSGQHAQVRPQGDGFVLEDLNSRNGTFLRVRGEATIEPGEVMLVGRVLLRVVAQ